MYWNREIETLTTNNLKGLQLERLRRTVARAGQSQFYGQRLQQAGIVPDDLGSLEDIRKLPFTTKDDLRTSSLQMLTTPLKEIIRLHASSGTTGQATVIYYTRTDIELWADLVARSLYMTGMRQEDVFQNMMGYGLFTGGLGA
ncbi:MAG TPA: phenylacetate--CoA ligase, partial [Desulfobacterales bacterium]|nr:phenylacetate--CoA ligase [Desulfobacterales bacterium]